MHDLVQYLKSLVVISPPGFSLVKISERLLNFESESFEGIVGFSHLVVVIDECSESFFSGVGLVEYLSFKVSEFIHGKVGELAEVSLFHVLLGINRRKNRVGQGFFKLDSGDCSDCECKAK